MDNNRQQLIPSADLADFYAKKISTCLAIIYNYKDELERNRLYIKKINSELEEIYKQIRNRLIRHEYKSMADKYEELDKQLNQLKPFAKKYMKGQDEERIKHTVVTQDYSNYKRLVKEKECLIWDCLDVLGLLGKVEQKTRRLR